MSNWSSEIKELERLYESLKGQLPETEKELGQLLKTDDANVVLLYSRRCLEVIITDLCECELKRPRKTEPLKGIIDKLNKEGKVPSHIITSMHGLNELSTYGAHPKDFDPEQVKPVLGNLTVIIRWYLRYKETKVAEKVRSVEKETTRERPFVDTDGKAKDPEIKKPFKLTGQKLLSGIAILTILVVAAVFTYPQIFKKDKLGNLISSDGRISVAVMPFRNMTNDTIWNVWQDGIKDNLITFLSNFSEDLTVKQPESVNGMLQSSGLTNYASLTPSIAGTISRKLDASIFVSGGISQAGSTIRINAQLVNSKSEEAFKSFQIEGTSEEEIFQIIDSLSGLIKDYLIISVMEKEIVTDFRQLISTRSSEAYRYYLYGNQAFYKLDDYTAKDWYLKAIDIDTNFTEAIRMLAYSYSHIGMGEEAKEWCLRLYRKRDQMSMLEKLYANTLYAAFFETIYEQIKYWSLIIDYDEQMPVPYSNLAGCYETLHQYEKAISLREKELEIYDKWDSRPRWCLSYTSLGKLYHLTGLYGKERQLYRKAEQDFPDDYSVLYWQAVLALTEKDTDEANQLVERYISARQINVASEATLASDIAGIYSEAGIPDKAEEYLRKALSLEPESPDRLNKLAWFLIDNDRNPDAGLELVDKALQTKPDYFVFLDTKGWGLYKQGRYEEALEIIQKSWDLKPYYYDYKIYLHLEEVKKAVAGQK